MEEVNESLRHHSCALWINPSSGKGFGGHRWKTFDPVGI
jgi:hypothetical protein